MSWECERSSQRLCRLIDGRSTWSLCRRFWPKRTRPSDGTSAFPDLNLFLYSYVRKEAVLSSQIEGTQSSLLRSPASSENAETPGVPLDDVQEVSNYVAALNHGLKRLRGGFPLSLRLIREIHEVLLSKGRGSHAQPGEFRKSQSWAIITLTPPLD